MADLLAGRAGGPKLADELRPLRPVAPLVSMVECGFRV